MAVSPSILVILGPTASGKSAVSLGIAERLGADILSVDSMQVYSGMDIGTAKPSVAERARVRHHLLDVATPDSIYTVARFVASADAVIADCGRRQAPLIATGGTPLYYKALFDGLFKGPGADAAIRERLAISSDEELAARLREIDPAAAARIHTNDTKRLIRALEVYELTGKPISSFQTEWLAGQRRHPALWIGLSWDKDALNRRINARAKQMLAGGWLDEVRGLLGQYPMLSQTAGEATGYGILADHLRGNLSLDDAIEQIKISTRQLARRQMKWFRRFSDVHWIAGDRPAEQIVDDVISRWSGPGSPA